MEKPAASSEPLSCKTSESDADPTARVESHLAEFDEACRVVRLTVRSEQEHVRQADDASDQRAIVVHRLRLVDKPSGIKDDVDGRARSVVRLTSVSDRARSARDKRRRRAARAPRNNSSSDTTCARSPALCSRSASDRTAPLDVSRDLRRRQCSRTGRTRRRITRREIVLVIPAATSIWLFAI